MTCQLHSSAWLLAIISVCALLSQQAAQAVEIEAFEFNDVAGTLLVNAVNTGTADIGVWVEDAGMLPSDIRGGSYNIVKSSSILESNYFQISNITSGTVYLVTRLSGWNFQNFDAANLEEFRMAFLDDDDANFGSTITAQMSIRRDSSGGIVLSADALGTGARNIPGTAPLATQQPQPFTAVLELNKTSNTYKVFYKDGNSPTQVLGIGAVASTRNGNSVRMAANNSFGDFSLDYPIDYIEVLSVDRIAVADTNPFTDLISLEIDRTTGAITLRNTSGVALPGLQSYSITSATGAFDPSKWNTVAGHYDSAGNGSVDNAPWAVTTSSKTELAEMFQSGDGGNLANAQAVVLSTVGGGAWLQSPFEDVHMKLNFAGGVARTVNVNFVGNNDRKWSPGDLNFDNVVSAADWTVFITNSETSLTGLSMVEAYRRGDLNGDGFNNIADFIQFRTLYDDANGAGSFEAMLASVPEPTSTALLLAAGAAFFSIGHRRRFALSHGWFAFLLLVLALCGSQPHAHAAILEDFPFNDPNGSQLAEVDNAANPGNNWESPTTGSGELTNSSVLNGSFRLQKDTTALSSNYIDIANVTTGKVWLVAELAGWNFTTTASSPSEEVRFAFIDNDNMPPSGSTITAQMDIRRSGSALALVGIGALGTGATNVAGSYALPLVRSTPFTMVLELDKTLDQYSVYYKDNTDPHQLLGTANLGASTLNPGDRDGNSIRFAPTGQFNDTGEFFDIDRIYLTDTSPIGGPVEPTALTLRVLSNGAVSILNDTDAPIQFDSYRILSASSSLSFSNWDSLSDKNPLLNPVDGPDAGTIAGDGIGETWDEAGGSTDAVLSESFLLGSTTLSPNDVLSLGSAFKPGGTQDLTFEYHDFVTGAIVVGRVDYATAAGVPGDYNNSGTVDAADYVLWRDNLNSNNTLPNDTTPGTVTPADYDVWRANFGRTAGSAAATALGSSVPEAGSLLLLLIGASGLALSGRSRSARGRW